MIRPRILRIFNFLEFVTFEELILLFVEKGLMRSNSGKNQGFQLKFADFSKVDEEQSITSSFMCNVNNNVFFKDK